MPDNKQQKVLAYALRRFMSSGYSAVSMDEIARGCGISKATLYMLFSSKEALMMDVVESITGEIESKVSVVISHPALSIVEKMERFFIPVAQMLAHINASALSDIQRCIPEAFEKIDAARRRIVLQSIGTLLCEGKIAGVVRHDVDEQTVGHMIIGAATHIINPDVLLEFGQTPDRILNAMKTVVIRGCLTETGMRQLESRD